MPKPPILSRSLSETLYENLGRVHSMQSVRKALDTTGRDNAMHARRILEQNSLNYNLYCCAKIYQEGCQDSELECALCFTEFEATDTDLMRLPCGLRSCRTCLQVSTRVAWFLALVLVWFLGFFARVCFLRGMHPLPPSVCTQ